MMMLMLAQIVLPSLTCISAAHMSSWEPDDNVDDDDNYGENGDDDNYGDNGDNGDDVTEWCGQYSTSAELYKALNWAEADKVGEE